MTGVQTCALPIFEIDKCLNTCNWLYSESLLGGSPETQHWVQKKEALATMPGTITPTSLTPSSSFTFGRVLKALCPTSYCLT